MLVSLHLPKTAGSSFLAALESHYGNKILRDYSDYPINTAVFRRNMSSLKMCALNATKSNRDIKCIHGHFLPLKYLLCRDARFVTWMRDPIERLASQYFYWLRNYNPLNAPPLHRRVVEEKWSLERFCLSPELKNFYSQFLWGFPISRFDFIGVTEYYESEMEYFCNNFLGTMLDIYSKNQNPSQYGTSYFEDVCLREKVQQYHSKDVALYKQVLNKRDCRKKF